jgi:hypothetical protein
MGRVTAREERRKGKTGDGVDDGRQGDRRYEQALRQNLRMMTLISYGVRFQ